MRLTQPCGSRKAKDQLKCGPKAPSRITIACLIELVREPEAWPAERFYRMYMVTMAEVEGYRLTMYPYSVLQCQCYQNDLVNRVRHGWYEVNVEALRKAIDGEAVHTDFLDLALAAREAP